MVVRGTGEGQNASFFFFFGRLSMYEMHEVWTLVDSISHKYISDNRISNQVQNLIQPDKFHKINQIT